MQQLVLSLPRWARWLLARDPQVTSRGLAVALLAIFAHYRRVERKGGSNQDDARGGNPAEPGWTRGSSLATRRDARVGNRGPRDPPAALRHGCFHLTKLRVERREGNVR